MVSKYWKRRVAFTGLNYFYLYCYALCAFIKEHLKNCQKVALKEHFTTILKVHNICFYCILVDEEFYNTRTGGTRRFRDFSGLKITLLDSSRDGIDDTRV